MTQVLASICCKRKVMAILRRRMIKRSQTFTNGPFSDLASIGDLAALWDNAIRALGVQDDAGSSAPRLAFR